MVRRKTGKTTMNRANRMAIVTLGCTAIMTGCSDSSTPLLNMQAPPMNVQRTVGVWNASGVVVDDENQNVDCLIAETLEISCRFNIYGHDFVAALKGTLEVDGSQLTGSGTYYAAPGETLPDGTTTAEFIISSGRVSEFQFLNLSVSAAGIEFFLSLDYNAQLTDRGSDFSNVDGPYSEFNVFGNSASFSVDADGVISSQSRVGCIGNGQIGLIDTRFNVYAVTFAVMNCGALDDSYSGFGLTSTRVVRDNEEFDNPTANEVFAFNVFTNQTVIDGIAIK